MSLIPGTTAPESIPGIPWAIPSRDLSGSHGPCTGTPAQGLGRSCFRRPLSEPCVRFSLTRLSTGRSVLRLVSHRDTLQRCSSLRIVLLQGLPSIPVMLSGHSNGTMPRSDSLSAPIWADRGGSLQFRLRLSRRSASSTPEGSWRLRFPGLHRFHGLRPIYRGSAPSCAPSQEQPDDAADFA